MVDLEGIEAVRRDYHGVVFRIDGLSMKDDEVERANLIFPWLIWIHERWREFSKGKLWLVGMEQEIILNLWYVLGLVV